jgi:hypothetical protein
MFLTGALLLYASILMVGGGALGWALSTDRAATRDGASFVEAGVWVAAVGGGLVLARRMLAAGVRPNDEDVEKRKELGRQLARTRAKFDRLLTAAESHGSSDAGRANEVTE